MSGQIRLGGAAVAAAVAIAGCGGGDGGAPAGERERGQTEAAPGREAPVPALRLRRLGEFRNPVYLAQPPNVRDLLFVVEKRGTVRVLRNGRELDRPFLDLSGRVVDRGTEQGLLSVAFAPAYRQSRRLYVAYTEKPRGDLRIDELRASRRHPTVVQPGSRRKVLVVPQPSPIHNGGQLAFGPDRKLYIGTGDGGPSYDPDDRGQDKRSLLGKILRIRPRRAGPGTPYRVPRNNPLRGRGRSEIWALGLRNPWRFSFDPRTDALLIGDVGQDQIEEIDFVRPGRVRGANFGWSGFEGTRPFKPGEQPRRAIRPLHEYTHEGRCSVTAGHVVRTPTLPSLRGRFLFGDFCDGELRSLVPPSDGDRKDVRREGLRVPALVSFGTDDRRRIYLVSLNGPVYRLVER